MFWRTIFNLYARTNYVLRTLESHEKRPKCPTNRPRSHDLIHAVSYYIKRGKTSWTYSFVYQAVGEDYPKCAHFFIGHFLFSRQTDQRVKLPTDHNPRPNRFYGSNFFLFGRVDASPVFWSDGHSVLWSLCRLNRHLVEHILNLHVKVLVAQHPVVSAEAAETATRKREVAYNR